jgi:hypothetical protein
MQVESHPLETAPADAIFELAFLKRRGWFLIQ